MDHETISDDEIRCVQQKLEGIIPDARRIVISLSSETDLSEDRWRPLALCLMDLGVLANRLLEAWKVGSRGPSKRGRRAGGAADAVGAAGLGDAVLDAPGAAPTPAPGRLLTPRLQRWAGARSVEAGPPRGNGKS